MNDYDERSPRGGDDGNPGGFFGGLFGSLFGDYGLDQPTYTTTPPPTQHQPTAAEQAYANAYSGYGAFLARQEANEEWDLTCQRIKDGLRLFFYGIIAVLVDEGLIGQKWYERWPLHTLLSPESPNP